ncbi:hypothetical protein N5E99_19510 [Pseudomonas chengduensis]|jgi:hypothetical protein|uniref:Uncharacterized protein n=1 Tax=Ectopseudomonas chengduensis TaxID=489632 RepID=A0A1G6TYY7_9GAMM|nr:MULTISPECIES: hypothetical protein [Pseudomonas]MBP3062723.1 hypothetical protein [Pseudomonas chengduensis]MDH0957523.1 hypothetical protein [Pseudomonas chengduensis]MDH1537945.1 hypothetical protein [Pseudomonas chengduensis]MDH1621806.1 hypothetical protein [Pseudomonas chengduensis]MDH1868628.1 hypothetical protein [Pseudomonas chengduensis]
MDIEYFFIERTKFIKYFYEHAIQPFEEIAEAIEEHKEPFAPPYSEDPEPLFLTEWLDAKTGIETVGHTALSMLSSSLQLFLKEWVKRLERQHGMKFDVNFKKNGWLNGYLEIFKQLELHIAQCPADISIIEQVTLARNRVQHPEQITNLNICHSNDDLKKYPRPFFAQEQEMSLSSSDEQDPTSWWLPLSLASTKEKIFEAIAQVESLCSWLESEYWNARNA